MKITKKAFDAAVAAAVSRDRLSRSNPTLQTLTVDFDNRVIKIDGRLIDVPYLAWHMPVLTGRGVYISEGNLLRDQDRGPLG